MNYNEALVEGIAVLATRASASTTGTTSVGVFQANTLNRIVFDCLVTPDSTNATTWTATLQGATTSGATFTTIPTGTAAPNLYAPTITSTTTTATLYRFEYTTEAIQQAIDSYTTPTNLQPWLRLLWSVSSGTTTFSAVAYAISDSYPAADIKINPFTSSTTAICPATNMFLNGTNINNKPYTTTALANPVLPA